jgi:toxin ParE1/3/4
MPDFIITRAAQTDIDEILIYIAADDIEAAVNLVEKFSERFRMLGVNPNAGRERPELKEDLRSFGEGNYVIFYQKWAGKIAIVRVLHTSRDLDGIFR